MSMIGECWLGNEKKNHQESIPMKSQYDLFITSAKPEFAQSNYGIYASFAESKYRFEVNDRSTNAMNIQKVSTKKTSTTSMMLFLFLREE